ncbi:hypothetical protein [Methylobacterium sp. SI9]|uniref:hypothetical protein n=1 Tax=Methylobacterium guangdongense TaxID=3138811 RepID=UPI00313BB4F6
MRKMYRLPIASVMTLYLAGPSYALEAGRYENYVRHIIKSTVNGRNVEEDLFDKQLLSYWNKIIKKHKCFTVQGLDAELSMHQDSNVHNIIIHTPTATKIGYKVRATYIVSGDKIDKDFYLVEQSNSLKIYDVCDHPSVVGDQCYRFIIKKGICMD